MAVIQPGIGRGRSALHCTQLAEFAAGAAEPSSEKALEIVSADLIDESIDPRCGQHPVNQKRGLVRAGPALVRRLECAIRRVGWLVHLEIDPDASGQQYQPSARRFLEIWRGWHGRAVRRHCQPFGT